MNFIRYTLTRKFTLTSLAATLVSILASVGSYFFGGAPLLLYIIASTLFSVISGMIAGSWYRFTRYRSFNRKNDLIK